MMGTHGVFLFIILVYLALSHVSKHGPRHRTILYPPQQIPIPLGSDLPLRLQ